MQWNIFLLSTFQFYNYAGCVKSWTAKIWKNLLACKNQRCSWKLEKNCKADRERFLTKSAYVNTFGETFNLSKTVFLQTEVLFFLQESLFLKKRIVWSCFRLLWSIVKLRFPTCSLQATHTHFSSLWICLVFELLSRILTCFLAKTTLCCFAGFIWFFSYTTDLCLYKVKYMLYWTLSSRQLNYNIQYYTENN